jgi:hypothetical protein
LLQDAHVVRHLEIFRVDLLDWSFVLIGGVGAGTVLTLLFLPALYAIWFTVTKPGDYGMT